ncbi:MAG: hypothetical protein HQL46_16355 [Gammaproteobacteria bacterium]|nr:hypothetical protein [Gammaproteobacteria bacterium]
MSTKHIQNSSYQRQAFYLVSQGKKLFALFYQPNANVLGQLLVFPPFAEEMNRSRRQIIDLAGQLANSGYQVLIIDLFGTGDSEGDFSEANWDIWQANMLDGMKFLFEKTPSNSSLDILGIRLGCLLALDTLQSKNSILDKISINHFLSWQPVFNAKNHSQQFLRLQLTKKLTSSTNNSSNNSQNKNTYTEVAGYCYPLQLQDQLKFKDKLSQYNLTKINNFSLFQISPSETTTISKDIEDLLFYDPTIRPCSEIKIIQGKKFWQFYDIKPNKELIYQTVQAILDKRPVENNNE